MNALPFPTVLVPNSNEKENIAVFTMYNVHRRRVSFVNSPHLATVKSFCSWSQNYTNLGIFLVSGKCCKPIDGHVGFI